MIEMGYCTRYNGNIKIISEDCKRLVEHFLSKSNDDEQMSLSCSSFDGSTLRIDEDWKNRDDNMECVLSLIALFDKSAQGVVLSEGEDGENLQRFTIFGGSLTQEEGYIAYKNKEDGMIEFDEDTMDQLRLQINRLKSLVKCEKCGERINIKEFDFTKRKYYDAVKLLSKHNNLCEKCYRRYKKVVLELSEIEKKKTDLLKEVD